MDEHIDIYRALEEVVKSELDRNNSLTGSDVFQAYEALLISFLSEQNGKGPILPRGEAARRLFHELYRICEVRYQHPGQKEQSKKTLTQEELISCLNELIKASRTWKNLQTLPQPFRNNIEYT